MSDERMERAKKTRAKLASAPRTTDRQLPLEEEIIALTHGFIYGDIWSRPGLPMQTRSLITMAILATFILAKIVGALAGLRTSEDVERQGLDLNEHGEVGYEY